MRLHLLVLAAATVLLGFSADATSAATCRLPAQQALLRDFVGVQFATTGWWNSANVFTALVNDALLASAKRESNATFDTQLLSMLTLTYELHGSGGAGFVNDYNDDEGWWALMFARASELAEIRGNSTLAACFLNVSIYLWDDIAKSWNSSSAACGGGVWWSKAKTYKNAIANELFFALSASIARTLPRQAPSRGFFASWAQKELTWFLQSGMINNQSTINDGLTSSCRNNGGTTWTYNQGVLLGGLAELYQLDNNSDHLRLAVRIFTAAVAALTRGGILHEPCEPHCGQDGCQFKGIFARNVMYLFVVVTTVDGDEFVTAASAMAGFIRANAVSICASDSSASGELGLDWNGPFLNNSASACTTSSGYDCLVAQRLLGDYK
jgi:predicted alpha-1,6-mannanase (GH76 family)